MWVYEGNLKVEYQATTLALYELGIEKKTGEIAEVKNPRRLETHFRSPQLDLSKGNRNSVVIVSDEKE